MKSFWSKKSAVFHFIPGIIVLVFGMLALHFTVSLIQSTSTFKSQYTDQINALTVFHQKYYKFSKKFKERLRSANEYNLDEIKSDLSDVNDQFATLQRLDFGDGNDNNAQNAESEHILYLIGNGLKDTADTLILFEENMKSPRENQTGSILKNHIDETMHAIMFLEDTVIRKFQNEMNANNITEKETWLYWSVIIMGLSGFILALINGQRLHDVKKLNEERHQVYDMMHKRLAAMEMTNDGIIIVDNTGKTVFFNASLARILGIAEEDREIYYGKYWRSIFPDGDCDRLNNLVTSALMEESHWMGEFDISRDDGKVIHTEISSTLLPDGGMICTVQDISARHKAEIEKKDMEEQFYQAQKMEAIGRLAGGIAHDFNNILAAMNGYAEFLIEDLDEKGDQQKFAQNILTAGKQAKDLVDQVLTFSRKTHSAQEKIDAVPIIKEVQNMIDATMPKTIGLTVTIESSSVPLYANATQLSQVLMNLCVNAIDAMDDDHGDLSLLIDTVQASDIDLDNIYGDELPDPKFPPKVRIKEEGALRTILTLGHIKQDIEYAKISVSDTGTGMSKLVMEHVFEPFYTTKSVDEGTGLGLATVHGVMVSHRGMLAISSELGRGTKFDIYLPVHNESADDANKDNDNDIDAPVKAHEHDNEIKILLVEDQDVVMNMVTRMIERMGYEVYSASNGLIGLDIVRENPGEFDLIITDYNMPKMTGLEMAQQIYLDFPELPIILLSGYSEDKIQELIKQHPSIKTCLRKPVTKDTLEKQIKAVLTEKLKAE